MGVRTKQRGIVFVISGPSGSGKTTLVLRLLRGGSLPRSFVRSVSFTTRPRRPHERNGEDYFFISEEEFQTALKKKKILEATTYLGYHYATPRDYVEKQLARGKHILLCLDIHGARRLRRLYPQKTITIFVMPPSLGALVQRIEKRRCKTRRKEILQRLRIAKEELKNASRYDHCVVNRDLNETVVKVRRIILQAIASSSRAQGRAQNKRAKR